MYIWFLYIVWASAYDIFMCSTHLKYIGNFLYPDLWYKNVRWHYVCIMFPPCNSVFSLGHVPQICILNVWIYTNVFLSDPTITETKPICITDNEYFIQTHTMYIYCEPNYHIHLHARFVLYARINFHLQIALYALPLHANTK